MKFFCNDLGIRTMIIYFCFALIDLINDYKNHKKMFILVTVMFVWVFV